MSKKVLLLHTAWAVFTYALDEGLNLFKLGLVALGSKV